MAITHAAKKAIRKNERERVQNVGRKRKLRDLLKKVRVLIVGKKTEEAKKLLPQVYKILDKSAKVNLIKKNTASRIKSRITKAVSKVR